MSAIALRMTGADFLKLRRKRWLGAGCRCF